MEQLVNFIIRPPRAEYDPEHDLLDQEFMLKGKWYQRRDIEVKNSREEILRCSHYMPIINPEGKALPCVIYCHGNSGCRADASEAAIMLLPLNITVFTLDFSGSGLSGGEHVTLGCNEKDDLKAVVDYLRADGNVSMIGLWGRSMGAVTGLMYGAEDPSIAGMVLDSPFSDLVDLMMELVDTYKVRLPKFTVKFAIHYMRRAIQKKAKFDIMDLNTIKVAKSCFVPVLLGHAIDDDFIQPHHSDRIFDAYVGDKNIIKFEGDHNSPRPQFYFDSISIFFKNVLQPPDDEMDEAFLDTTVHMHDYIDKASWDALRGLGYTGGNHVSPSKASSSAENATGQLRPKRPMSRMEVPTDIVLTDKQLESKQEVVAGDGSSQSSAGMISFELSNGNPDDPHVPAFIDDDQYVEYPLDYSADFPSDVEAEQRMLMEAMMESLKDLETRQPYDERPSSNAGSNFVETSQKSCTDAPSTNESCGTPNSGSAATAATDGKGVKFEPRSPDLCSSSEESVKGSTGDSTDTVTRKNAPGSSSEDSSQGTTATVTVVKSPSNNIMDGLFKRWDRHFFRSNREH